MFPWELEILARERRRELEAEAARERLSRSVEALACRRHGPWWSGLVAGLWQLVRRRIGVRSAPDLGTPEACTR